MMRRRLRCLAYSPGNTTLHYQKYWPQSTGIAASSTDFSTGNSAIIDRPAKKTFFAGIAALGCDIGTGKILRISREINAAELENTVHWYFYPESLQEVNDTLLRFMDRLELPQIYRRSADRLHTSSDGQKFEVRPDSLNANYSFKYFGKGKGVSIYSFIDERHFLFYSVVISAAERESAYVIDGLMHNDVIKSDIHSTDTHGYTEAIFGAMHLLASPMRQGSRTSSDNGSISSKTVSLSTKRNGQCVRQATSTPN